MNIKKIAASLLAAVVMASSAAIGAFADGFGVTDGILDEETGLLYVPLEDGTLKVTAPEYTRLEGDIVIPETFGEGDEAKTVTEIEFVYVALEATSFHIPKTITRIFNLGTTELREITVAEDNPFFSSEDGVLFNKDKTRIIQFPAKKAVTSYSIPSTVVEVKWGCFSGSEVESVSIPDSVERIGRHAFSDCENLTELNIPGNVAEIEGALVANSGVTSITVAPENSYYNSVDGVLYTADLKTLVAYPPQSPAKEYSIPDGTEIIGDGSFEGARNLDSIFIPDSVTTLCSYAFSYCGNLVSIEIPSKVTELADRVFNNCYSLETISLPLELKTIDPCAFYMFEFEYEGIKYTPTPKLKSIKYAGVQDDWDKIEIGVWGNDILSQATIYFADGTTGGADVPNADTIVQEPAVTENDDGTKDFTPGVKKNITTTDADVETMKNVKANAPADAFDEDVTMSVARDTFTSGGAGSFAVDISFVKADGSKVQPAKPVTVKIPVPESLKNAANIFVYHINDSGRAEKVEAQTETIDGVRYMVFEASRFSTYVLSDDSTVADTVNGGNNIGGGNGNTGTPSVPSAPDNTDNADSSASSDPSSSDASSVETEIGNSGNTEPASSDNTSSAAPSAPEGNPTTGIGVSALPLLAAISAVVVVKKKK